MTGELSRPLFTEPMFSEVVSPKVDSAFEVLAAFRAPEYLSGFRDDGLALQRVDEPLLEVPRCQVVRLVHLGRLVADGAARSRKRQIGGVVAAGVGVEINVVVVVEVVGAVHLHDALMNRTEVILKFLKTLL